MAHARTAAVPRLQRSNRMHDHRAARSRRRCALLVQCPSRLAPTRSTPTSTTSTSAATSSYDGEPLEGVEHDRRGQRLRQRTSTPDADGKWTVGVPEKDAKYTITLDETTLPKGVAVAEEGTHAERRRRPSSASANRSAGQLLPRRRRAQHDELLRPVRVERVVNGLNFGLMLALASIGLSLVFGTTGLSNFAHGEMVTFGAVAAYFFSTVLGMAASGSRSRRPCCSSGAFGFVLDVGTLETAAQTRASASCS